MIMVPAILFPAVLMIAGILALVLYLDERNPGLSEPPESGPNQRRRSRGQEPDAGNLGYRDLYSRAFLCERGPIPNFQ